MNSSTKIPRQTTPASPRLAPEDRARRYALAALAGEVARVDAAGEGELHLTFNHSVFRAFQLVPSGAITADEASNALVAAAERVGLSPSDIRGTLKSAGRDGQREARELRFEPDLDRKNWRTGQSRKASQGKIRTAQRPAPVAPRRPPRPELEALWTAARPVGLTMAPAPRNYLQACSYLNSRGFWPPDVGALDLVKILPEPDFSWPAWWPWGPAGRWTVALLAYEADGTPASLHARAVEFPGWPLPPDKPKARSPRGFETRELLFADRAGLALLRGEGPPPAAVLLAEGLTDTLALALYAARQGDSLAVLGLMAGGAPALASVAWTPGTTVVCFTDHDTAGDKYAAAAAASLPDSVTMFRAEIPYE